MLQSLVVRKSRDVLVTTETNLHYRCRVHYVLMSNDHNRHCSHLCMLDDLARSHQFISKASSCFPLCANPHMGLRASEAILRSYLSHPERRPFSRPNYP